ncbi:membrane protein, putative [Nitrobacter sp. Nb-311A]|nr:membrane protein, putative [Nitrobacter sp. Nb-311A]
MTAQLLLPVGAVIKFRMIPPIDKVNVASFVAVIGCLLFARGKPLPRSKGFGLVGLLLISNIASPIITSWLNPDNVVIGVRFLPGVGIYDALSASEAALIGLIPFILGRRYLRSIEDCKNILLALTIAGLCYSIPLLFEIRFSPQLHLWVYGYAPSEFVQSVREGGYRPMVFMGHGLLAALFMSSSVLAATTLWRNRVNVGVMPSSILAPYLGLVLFLCKSMGALIYGVVGGSLIIFTKPKTQVRIAVVLVAISLAFPLLRSLNLVPTTQVVELAKQISEARGESLEFRFENENKLLQRAFERPWFGWGRFGRSRIYDANSGRDTSVTDGRWIIDIGQFGLIGFFSEFGLLAISVFRAAASFQYLSSRKEQLMFTTLILIVAISVFDLLPNSGLIPWTWLISGALLGQSEALALRNSSMSNCFPANKTARR